jgi:uncharacterized protein YutD
MKKYKYNNINYELIKEYKNGFINEEVEPKMTDYFEEYDYILGDWAYGKLRLKGFCDKNNKRCNSTNEYNKIDDYIKNHCAYDCRYFILKKIP